ncbi:chemotaxis protein CheD [Geomonas sp. RF6]|uniref:chemotaxis protein CheD n=1 Tax=Geomonas sp. RF6 TaxID=2897342 RepID=UPI001E4D79B7|nr:chemotaxis protein CheD [Geomonas sp. RF6]UFS71322.1 chemotaxis protein CheD [Geomonas sp. RF6]
MTPRTPELPVLFLRPGEMHFADEPIVVSTLLGSCVAVTMFSPRHRIGTICHALLPHCRREDPCLAAEPEGGKYVECAIWLMLKGLQTRGVCRGEIEAKIFGGSDMFDARDGGIGTVGTQNIAKALEVLEGEGIRIVSSDVGGPRGRKIFFYTHTGEVLLKRLRRTEI